MLPFVLSVVGFTLLGIIVRAQQGSMAVGAYVGLLALVIVGFVVALWFLAAWLNG